MLGHNNIISKLNAYMSSIGELVVRKDTEIGLQALKFTP